MSYCRFSSDDFLCDVYAYESDMGYEVWVASSRFTVDIPKLTSWNDDSDAFFESYNAQMEAVSVAYEKGYTRKIGLPYDGKHFVYDTEADLLSGLKHLRSVGYHVPDSVIAGIENDLGN